MLRQQGLPGFTVLCCDNLPHNACRLERRVSIAPPALMALWRWIERDVAFPSTMVDRITPERTDGVCRDAQALIGCQDCAAVSTEPFHQWVVEDSFVHGCPDWTAGGAMPVDDVRPHEQMKLSRLNGAHSLIACCSVPAGIRLVRDACDVPALAAFTRRHLAAAIGICARPHGIDRGQHAEQILKRFRTPSIDHMTAQIAMDGCRYRIVDP